LMVVTELALLNVAMSVLAVPVVAPGNVLAPVLQLLTDGESQLLLAGVASQVALAAPASCAAPRTAAQTDNARGLNDMIFMGSWNVWVGLDRC
jgi:hypothetical protein